MNQKTQPYVTFFCGAQLYALPVHQVQDAMRAVALTPVPLAPESVLGLFVWRGRTVTAVDLAAVLQVKASSSTPSVFILVQVEHELVALAVDRLAELQHFAAAQVQKPDAATRAINGVVRAGDTRIFVLDLNALSGVMMPA